MVLGNRIMMEDEVPLPLGGFGLGWIRVEWVVWRVRPPYSASSPELSIAHSTSSTL
jgi:hypothetical protein